MVQLELAITFRLEHSAKAVLRSNSVILGDLKKFQVFVRYSHHTLLQSYEMCNYVCLA
jgi:hypothetical protein